MWRAAARMGRGLGVVAAGSGLIMAQDVTHTEGWGFGKKLSNAGSSTVSGATGNDVLEVRAWKDVGKKYIMHETLGKGKFGVVRRATMLSSGEQVAVKLIPKTLFGEGRARAEVVKEAKLMDLIFWHPHIVNLHDAFETEEYFVIVMDLASGGELFNRIVEKGSFSEADASDITRAIMSAVSHCHKRGVCHRDLKPENILLSSKENEIDVRICDFGLAAHVPSGAPVLKGKVGTCGYAAPETLRDDGNLYSPKVDEWSVGVILYILLGGYHPFDPDCTASDRKITKRIQRGSWGFNDSSWSHVSDAAKTLVSALLERDPSRRMSAEEALKHPWLTGDAASTRPLHKTAKRLAAYNEARKAWRNATDAAMREWFGHQQGGTHSPADDREALAAAFRLIDVDNNGYISRQELGSFLKRLEGKVSQQDIDSMLKAADVNSDGQVSMEEFIAMNI
mmetsp:Transcript_4640/g.13597  ORF Transcript_4640/g.13597 Transcript_4640/m.13597 type:complete len:451 (-) Transcript_4640:204-1556(-)